MSFACSYCNKRERLDQSVKSNYSELNFRVKRNDSTGTDKIVPILYCSYTCMQMDKHIHTDHNMSNEMYQHTRQTCYERKRYVSTPETHVNADIWISAQVV